MIIKTVLATFSDQQDAENAISELKGSGYNPRDMSILMRDTTAAQQVADTTGASVADGAMAGATTGGTIGAVAGFLAGVGAIAVPAAIPFLAAGPIAATLGLTGAAATTVTGAASGAVAGGLLGALMGMGIPESEAQGYEERIREGAIVLAVPVHDGSATDVQELLDENGADQIKVIRDDIAGDTRLPAYRDEYVEDADAPTIPAKQRIDHRQQPRSGMYAKGRRINS